QARITALPTYPFQHRRFWLTPSTASSADVSAAGLQRPDHPLLGALTQLADQDQMVFSSRLSVHTCGWLAGHRVHQEVVFPATGFIEVLLEAGLYADCSVIDELVLHTPLVLVRDHPSDVQITIGPVGDDLRRAFSVHARTAEHHNVSAWVLHATGILSTDQPGPWETPLTPPQTLDFIDHDSFYDQLDVHGLHYDPPFRGLTRIGEHPGSPGTIYAEATLPPDIDTNGYNIHPALLDSALQAVFFATADTENTVRLPFVLTGISLHATAATCLQIRLICTGTDTFQLHATDPTGAPVITINALTRRGLPAGTGELTPTTAGLSQGLFELTWPVLPREGSPTTELSPLWALVGSDCPRLAALFARDRIYPDLANIDLAHTDLVVWALPLSTLGSDDATPPTMAVGLDVDCLSRVHALTSDVLNELQQWLARAATGDTTLAILTRHAVSTSIYDRSPELSHAAVWGFIHSTQNEHPGRIHLIDVDLTPASEHTLLAILSTLHCPIRQSDVEPQLAIRHGNLHIPRLTATRQLALPPTACWQLTTTGKGDLANLTLVPVAATPVLAAGQIRVDIRASGLNFHDVVVALGAIADEGLGVEAAGVVIDVADDVRTVRPGDAVMGLFPNNSFAPIAVTDHRMVVAIPPGWSFAQAASVPAAFLTAYTALVELAGLSAAHRVLIHAGAGGVGQAAIAIANHVGAEIYATAHPSKHHILEDLGVARERIASSRTLDFLDLFTQTTGGRGMDVVLDCLRGDFVDASLSLLPHGGHFIEIGKTDIRDPSEVAASHPGVTYHAYDLSSAPPEHIARVLATLSLLFTAGILKPLPTTSYALSRATQAFRDMSQARHTGKLVLLPPMAFDAERTVLITGGTGMLGGVFAEHLVSHYGVGHLLLVSRRGLGAPGAVELHQRLTQLGARVTITACDLTDPAELSAVLDGIEAAHPLGAVIHTAGVVDDAVISELTTAQVDRVLAAKADTAWYLHELTAGKDLSAFVMFSSAAGVLGNPGQANYAAANAFVDALAHHRHRRQLPALSLAWGYWQTPSAMTAHLDPKDQARFARTGMLAITTAQGLQLFDTALAGQQPSLIPLPLNRQTLTRQARQHQLAPILSALTTVRPQAHSPASTVMAQLAGQSAAQQRQTVISM
ncbi:hypothetical protein B1T48_28515, partial [Mycobacterium persicum]